MAVVFALLSSVLWGTGDFLGGLTARRLKAMAVVGGAQFAGLVAIAVYAAAVGAYDDPTGWLLWSMAAGAIGAAGLLAFYTALAIGTMGVVSPIAGLGAIVPVVVGLEQGDSLGTWTLLGLALALGGAVAASGPELSGAGGVRPVVLAAIAGVSFGLVFVGIDRGAESSPEMTMVGMRATSVAAFVMIAVAAHSLGGITTRDTVPLATIGLFDVAANLMFAIATTKGFVSVVSVLGSLYPVVTVLLARAVLHERLRGVQLVGVTTALAGVAIVAGT
ncbi:MAG: EamA family transporter [Nocardioidaceae bacterium]